MRVDDIGRTSPPEQLTYPLAVIAAQRFDADTRQHPRQIGLLAAIAPDLADNRRTRPQRGPEPLEHPQLGTNHTITTIDGDQRASVEYRLHATSERGARPSRDAAAASSASVKGPSSDSHASKAAPSSSFLSLSAAASLSHADTLIPCWAAACRNAVTQLGWHRHRESIYLRHTYDVIAHSCINKVSRSGAAACAVRGSAPRTRSPRRGRRG